MANPYPTRKMKCKAIYVNYLLRKLKDIVVEVKMEWLQKI